ncbi:MAG: hypothetical protein DMG69_27820 [Acidobacteria bacterium]|nr:MAG: hypothetical protein DMG69_27820 [Acidobacteriota bacterium]
MNSSSKSRPAFYGESPGYDTASEGTQLTCFHCVQSVKDEDANAARKTTTNYLTQCPQRSWIKFFAENFQPVIGPCSRYLEGFGSFPAFVEVIVRGLGVRVPTCLPFSLMHLHGIASRSRGYKMVYQKVPNAPAAPTSAKSDLQPCLSARSGPSRGLHCGPGSVWEEQTHHAVLRGPFRGRA